MSDRPAHNSQLERSNRLFERSLTPGGPHSLEGQEAVWGRYAGMTRPVDATSSADSLNAASVWRKRADEFDRGGGREEALGLAREHVQHARETRMASSISTTEQTERRVESQGSSTTQRSESPIANSAAAEVARDLANARVERVLAKYDKPHADAHKDKALQHLADARDAMSRQNQATDYWAAKIAVAPAQSGDGQVDGQRADARRGGTAKV